jgi:hypothetical protein
MASAKEKFCARCGIRHATTTGKRKCKRPLDSVNMDALDDVTDVPLDLEMPSAVQPARSDRSTDDRIDALLNVVSDLVSRVDSTQRQLDSLQLASAATVSTVLASADMDHYRSQGAIPKRPAGCVPAACSGDHQAATSQVPSLSQMRSNTDAVRQATHIVDSMDAGPSGTTSVNTIKTLRRGWSRQGGDFAPPVVVWDITFSYGGWNSKLVRRAGHR